MSYLIIRIVGPFGPFSKAWSRNFFANGSRVAAGLSQFHGLDPEVG